MALTERQKDFYHHICRGILKRYEELSFIKILNWEHYTPEKFAQVSMMESDGTTPKPELKEILNHPVMQSGIVDLGTIQFGHKIDEVGTIENYYMWELEKRGGKLFA